MSVAVPSSTIRPVGHRSDAAPAPSATAQESSLLPAPVGPPGSDAACVASLEALLAMIQDAEGKYAGAKLTEASADQKERTQKLAEAFKQIDEEARAHNSPGFFKAIFRVIKDFARDVFTDPAKTFSDLGKNLKEMVESPNFWSDLKTGCMWAAKVVGLVACAAAAVVTLGAASPLLVGAIVVLSVASALDSQFHVLQKLGVDPKIAGIVDMAMALASAVLSFGASTTASTSALIKAAKDIRAVAAVVQASTAVAGGVATAVDGGFEKARIDRAANQKELQNVMEQLDDEIKELLAEIKAQKENGSAENDAMTAAADARPQASQVLITVRA